MRDIKFRGKRKDNGEWVYGYYTKSPITDENSGLPMECGWYFLTGEERHLIIQDGVAFTVIPDTVGQYTGLHDKNGKEIYEGDIIRIRETEFDDWQVYLIEYHGDRDYPAFDTEPSIDCDCNGLSYAMACCELEKIGNIFENPELLEVSEC